MDTYLDRDNPIPLEHTFLKYTPTVYQYMLVKFGAQSEITKYLMRESVSVRISIAHLHNGPNVSEYLECLDIKRRWQDATNIFNEYHKANGSFELQYLPLFKTCPDVDIIKCLFEAPYLSLILINYYKRCVPLY
jgi:hypothetical protein